MEFEVGIGNGYTVRYTSDRLRTLVPYLIIRYVKDNIDEYINRYPDDGNFLRDFMIEVRKNNYKEVSLTDAIRYLRAVGFTVTEVEN